MFPDPQDPAADWRIRAFRVDWRDVDEHSPRLLEDQPHEISSAYDALNRVRIVRYPRDVEDQRRALTYAYNRGGTIQRLLVDGIPFVERIGYDAKGRPQMMALANGVMTLYAYDSGARVVFAGWCVHAFRSTVTERFSQRRSRLPKPGRRTCIRISPVMTICPGTRYACATARRAAAF